ncbi:TPA: recombinase, partial [Bacillus toyonensis]|nr:recombinase [Bacillus toyonensis]
EGITIALQKGVKFGRKKIEIDDNFIETYQEWKNHKITAVEAMQKVGMKSNTFYRRVKEYEDNLEKSKIS